MQSLLATVGNIKINILYGFEIKEVVPCGKYNFAKVVGMLLSLPVFNTSVCVCLQNTKFKGLPWRCSKTIVQVATFSPILKVICITNIKTVVHSTCTEVANHIKLWYVTYRTPRRFLSNSLGNSWGANSSRGKHPCNTSKWRRKKLRSS
jgi:hypothetical protein